MYSQPRSSAGKLAWEPCRLWINPDPPVASWEQAKQTWETIIRNIYRTWQHWQAWWCMRTNRFLGGRTLDALRPTRFQREAAVSGLGSSKKETVLWLSRAKSSACHLQFTIIIERNHKPSQTQSKGLFPRNQEAQLLELLSTSVTMDENKFGVYSTAFKWDRITGKSVKEGEAP